MTQMDDDQVLETTAQTLVGQDKEVIDLESTVAALKEKRIRQLESEARTHHRLIEKGVIEPPKPRDSLVEKPTPPDKLLKTSMDEINKRIQARINSGEFIKRESELKERRRQDEDTSMRRLASDLAGPGSLYAGIRLNCPAQHKTTALSFLRGEWDSAGGSIHSMETMYILRGGTGCGKTHAAIALLAEVNKGSACFYIKMLQLVEAVTNRDQSLLTKVKTVHYLVIDDLGAESHAIDGGYKIQDFMLYFDLMFDLRYEKRLFTLFTTNLSSTEITKRYGERFWSRFNEVGYFKTVDGPDLRKKKGHAEGNSA